MCGRSVVGLAGGNCCKSVKISALRTRAKAIDCKKELTRRAYELLPWEKLPLEEPPEGAVELNIPPTPCPPCALPPDPHRLPPPDEGEVELPPAPAPEVEDEDDPVGIAFMDTEYEPFDPALLPAELAEVASPEAEDTVSSDDEPELAVESLDPDPSRRVRCSLESPEAEEALA